MSDYLDPNNEELLRDFFEEAQLQIDLMEQNILVLENDSIDRDSVDEIFRAAHTLKGGAATVQMDELAGFTHLMEDVLDEVRNDSIKVTASVVDIILSAVDVIKLMLEARKDGYIYDDGEDIEFAKVRLNQLLSGDGQSLVPQSQLVNNASISAPDSRSVADDFMTKYEIYELFENAGKGNPVYRLKVLFEEDTLMNTVGGIQVYSILKNVGIVLKTTPDFELLNEDVFHPFVYYYLTTEESEEVLQKILTISDVTVGCQILLITEQMIEGNTDTVSSLSQEQATPPSFKPVAESLKQVVPLSTQVDSLTPSSPPVLTPATNIVPSPSISQKRVSLKKDNSSILRVDSRKIDNLLNMVSEAVINKSTINKVTVDLSEIQNKFQSLATSMEFDMRAIVDSIPEIIREIADGKDSREIVDRYRTRVEDIFLGTNIFETQLKKSVVDLKNAAQKLSINTANLQEGIMKIRMVPISNIFSRFPRLVRDLSHSLSKIIDLALEGEDTELDKSVIEDLLDPLIHCVRNSIDHGIELPSVRSAAGKPETGVITLKASNEGSMILIEVVDDGGGINPDKIFQKAIEKGIISPETKLTESEIFNLLYTPGFSTSEKVSNVSGRGVGMDVVKTQIEKLKGSISISSEVGKGSRFSIRLPLTLAIIQGLLVRVGREIYSIPVTSIVDSHRISNKDIHFVNNYEVFNVRNEVVFLTRMNKLFGIKAHNENAHKYVVIVGSAEKKMGLVVDQLLGEEDVVIKPLKDDFSNTPGIAGATILGDGKVSLIIDVTQLLELGAIKQIESKQKENYMIGM